MKMKSVISLTALTVVLGCEAQTQNRHLRTMRAIALNDSATRLVMKGENDSIVYGLLQKAIKIDSDCYMCYHNRLTIESRRGDYNEVLGTLGEMKRIKPEEITLPAMFGMVYYKLGNRKKAEEYFKDGVRIYDSALAVIDKGDKMYDLHLTNKGFLLVLLGKGKEGNNMIRGTEFGKTFLDDSGRYKRLERDEVINQIFP